MFGELDGASLPWMSATHGDASGRLVASDFKHMQASSHSKKWKLEMKENVDRGH